MAKLLMVIDSSNHLTHRDARVSGTLEEIEQYLDENQTELEECQIVTKRKFAQSHLAELVRFPHIKYISLEESHLTERERNRLGPVPAIDLTILERFPHLEKLRLIDCAPQLNGIEYCSGLQELELTYTQTTDLSLLSHLPLKRLSFVTKAWDESTGLRSNQVLLESLAPINRELETLAITFSRSTIDLLQNAGRFPNLKVLYLVFDGYVGTFYNWHTELQNRQQTIPEKYQHLPIEHQYCCTWLHESGCVELVHEIVSTISDQEDFCVRYLIHHSSGDLKEALSHCRS